MGERSGCGRARGVGDAVQGGEHAAGEQPPSYESEYQQDRQNFGCSWSENAQESGLDGKNTMNNGGTDERTVGDVTQEEQPHGAE